MKGRRGNKTIRDGDQSEGEGKVRWPHVCDPDGKREKYFSVLPHEQRIYMDPIKKSRRYELYRARIVWLSYYWKLGNEKAESSSKDLKYGIQDGKRGEKK